MLLHDFVPEADVRERHTRFVPAPRDAVLAALKTLRLSEMSPLVTVLLAIRGLPGMLVERQRLQRKPDTRPLLEGMMADGFALLADTPAEMVLGLAAQPWKLVHPRVVPVATPGEFKDLADPTLARIAINFTLEDQPGGTLLTTETRVRVPDVEARRCFLRYWFFIRLGSGLIRLLWLRAAARKAVAQAEGEGTQGRPIADSKCGTTRGEP